MGLFEFIYYIGYRARTFSDLKRQRRLPKKVICVGNLTTGGTGKTPATIALSKDAQKRGFTPCVLTRGYKGRLEGPVIVKAGMDARDVGDEPLLMAEKLEGISVIKGADRHASGMFAIENVKPEPDLFILDDGFQHRRLWRDLDILLVNSKNPFGNWKLLPMGVLREPLEQMERAGVVVMTKSTGEDLTDLMEFIRKYNSRAPVFEASHAPVSLRKLNGEEMPPGELKGKEVFAFCAIAGPQNFMDDLRRAGADIRGHRAYIDHHVYTQGDIDVIWQAARECGAEWIVTTEKDIMRLKGSVKWSAGTTLVSAGIEFKAENGFYDAVFGGLNA
jgi:tetraacyldisaccharide 4'-kinase